jgi:hypothetical protein
MKSGHWRRFLRLFLFVVELYTLFVLLNITFLLPFPYDLWRFSMVIGAALISLTVACWLQFLRLRSDEGAVSAGSIELSAPVVPWVSVAVICIPRRYTGCGCTQRINGHNGRYLQRHPYASKSTHKPYWVKSVGGIASPISHGSLSCSSIEPISWQHVP